MTAGERAPAMTIPPLLPVLFLPGFAMMAPEAEFLRTVGPETGAIFLQIEGIAGWADGSCVVSDRLAGCIALIDPSGKLITEASTRTADHPSGPACIDSHDTLVAVADFASTRVQLFSRQLRPLAEFHSEGAVVDLCFADGGTLWLSAHTHGGKTLLHYGITGELLGRITPRALSGESFSDLFFCAPGSDGTVWLAYCVRNIIELYDSSGTFLRSLSIPGLPAEPPTRSIRRGLFGPTLYLPEGPLIRSIAADSNGNLLVLGGNYGEHPGRDLYSIARYGEEITRRTLTRPAAQIWANSAKLLFAVDESKSLIDLYRLHYHTQKP
jgi:hypothetical protein